MGCVELTAHEIKSDFNRAEHKAVAANERLPFRLTIHRGGEGATEAEQKANKSSASLGLVGAAGSLNGMERQVLPAQEFYYRPGSRVSR
jgi:hypothetical protein